VVETYHFEQWYVGVHPKLISALTVIAGDAALGAEVVDEAVTRAYERWNRVGAMASPEGWTYRTALNVLRRRQRRLRAEHQLHLRRAPRSRRATPGTDWSVEVWDALRRLPPRQRTAVALRYVADLPIEEIAATMRVAPGTVKATLHAARQRLAVALADELEEVSDG
jgi:RNA polymerase sigma-70 factor (ECF subfamily)